MKKLIISGFLLVGIGSTIWFYKYEILIASLPTIVNIANPVEENKSIYWSKDTSLNKNLELQKKPNVIIILADDLGFNDISLYNGGAADGTLMTPNIDELANTGVRFDKGYAANAVCAPSRASIITFPLVDNLDPNNVIYLFGSLWGASQLLLLLFYVVIITRYKSLLSFLWITVILDVLFRFISGYLHPLTFEYYSYTPPGKLSNLPILIYSLVMLNFSLKHSKK